jgi:hypothetical protein
VSAQIHICRDPSFQSLQSELLEAGHLRLAQRPARNIRQRLAAPQSKRLIQQIRCTLPRAAPRLYLSLPAELGELYKVDFIVISLNEVA